MRALVFTVRRIAVYDKLGYAAEEIAAKYGHITLAGVHAALAYYYANREEIEADLAADEAAEAEYSPQTQVESTR